MGAEPCIRQERDGSVLIIKIQNPTRKNALGVDAYRQLTGALERAAGCPDIRSVVITGSDQFFCSGHDVDDFLARPIKDQGHPVYQFMLSLSRFEKPVIAAVEGFAVGIGVTLLLHCDLVYAGRSSFFKMPFTRLGLCPEFAATFIIPRCAGHQIASELLLLGRTFSAERFAGVGLINQVCEDGTAFSAAMKSAREIDSLPEISVQYTKGLIKAAGQERINQSMQQELALLIELFDTGVFRGRG